MVNLFQKFDLAKKLVDVFNEVKDSDEDHNGIPDRAEDFKNLTALAAAAKGHDAGTVLEIVEEIIRRDGPTAEKIAKKFNVDLAKLGG